MTLRTKIDKFSEKFRGGGGIFNPKIYIADFCHYKGYFSHEFWKKNPQHDFPKMRGGGQRPFGTFPKIHPFLKGQASLRCSILHPARISIKSNPSMHLFIAPRCYIRLRRVILIRKGTAGENHSAFWKLSG